ncbi:hypothetical protein HH212_00805 [Massilia forsythiae]|uniref:Secretion system X translation initiation factor n=1 Tax=Massilia forsythiae TaxID=2728020 RepID=A0A7Z2VT87_9BURK|nr:hypothetical protein [Massilia forsythiae]QJD98760.1 hypothetical protein HH212_00805 [Massilia forsythiae]
MKPALNLALKPRHLALGAALAAAAALVLFGDRNPDGDVAEAVERPAAARTDLRAAARSDGAAPGVSAPAVAGGDAALVPAARPPSAAAGTDGAATVGAADAHGAAAAGQPILALVPREILIGDSEGRFGQAQNGAPFGSRNWTPPPPPAPPSAPPPPPPPPTAPPLPFTFIGKSVGEGVIEVYLARGDRTFTARADTVIDGTYRVDAIAPPVLTLTYLPLNQVQQLNIGVFE